MKLNQPFHLVTLSPWPLLLSFSILSLLINFINFFYYKIYLNFMISILMIIICLYQWWRDVVRESLYQGFHTIKIINGLKLGMILFIISEIFFFLSIFWTYMHMFLSPSIEIGSSWPPYNIIMFNPYLIPLLNTIILLSSGISITWCHYSILKMKKLSSLMSLFLTIFMGLIFMIFQLYEYLNCSFSISDSIYGSIFFMLTGFHGLHVLIGSLFLIINFFRLFMNNFSKYHHFGFEASAWYWHFVDIVWLFLFLLIYILI